jgi:hypothetical protein
VRESSTAATVTIDRAAGERVRENEKSKRVTERSITTINYIRLLAVQWKASKSRVYCSASSMETYRRRCYVSRELRTRRYEKWHHLMCSPLFVEGREISPKVSFLQNIMDFNSPHFSF